MGASPAAISTRTRHAVRGCLTICATVGWLNAGLATAAEDQFRDRVAPILQRRCVSCHQDESPKGDLSLQTEVGLRKGGESGPVVVAGQPDASLLIDHVSGTKPEMPKGQAPLKPGEVAELRRWIETGAKWSADLHLTERPAADLDWWSLRPVQRPNPPPLAPEDERRVRTPIDRFVLAAVRSHGLPPSPPADRRALIRRLSFDLTGLPPTADEVDAFVASTDPRAYEQLVDRLLESPRYGERWARHWLDIVHYGDTHGYDKDKLRPHAWPYRDYVIRAFNQDKPYARFVEEQLAGDQLYPHTVDGIAALGFIAAGPWDFISHVEVPETKIDGRIARNLDRDDMVVNTLNTFCSLTVQCARCHHHKFDPLSMEDYYRLQAVFAALDRADRPYDADPQVAARRRELVAQRGSLVARQAAIAAEVERRAGPPLEELDRRLRELKQALDAKLQVPPQHGYHSAIERSDDRVKWVQVDLGQPVELAAVELIGCHDTFNSIGAGFGFPVRYKIEAAADAAFQQDVQSLADQTDADVPNPGIDPVRTELKQIKGRFVRVTATRLAPRQNDYIFALSELRIFDGRGTNLAAQRPVTSLDSIEAGPRWGRANLVDGLFPARPQPASREELARVEGQRAALLARTVPPEVTAPRAELARQLVEVDRALAELPAQQVVYAGTVHTGSGNFLGTGAQGGKPRPIHILKRGDVRTPLAEVTPNVPPLVPELDPFATLRPDDPEGARRVALARWITDRRHPLTWRTVVNRVWQYHFGRGLVDSPSDFGRMGQQPSHPELLDWLAAEFRDGGQSLKSLHRLIVNSSTYQQAAADNPDCDRRDAGNVYLWRMNRRKLEAEAIRDSVLLVAGKLDLTMGGPGFQDFVIQRPEHSPHFEYQLHDPEDPRTHRRSIYRFLVRSQPQPFMTTLDCADPSMSVDKRNETINSLQALALLNNKLTIAMARHFAARVEPLAADPRGRTRAAVRLALSRDPTNEELEVLTAYTTHYGLANTCRVLFNLNEFAFVD